MTAANSSRSLVHYCVVVVNVFLVGAALCAASLVFYASQQASAINRVALGDSLTDVSDTQGQRVMNILLVGSDSSANLDPDDPIQLGRQGQRLGDVIIIAHLDERTGDLALLSLPRDLWVEIPELGRSHRINKAFEAGGPQMLIETIEANFDIPINHYVNVDFAGFQGLVEAVGTVSINFDAPARDWNTNVEPARTQTGFQMLNQGCQALTPDQALAYVRSRYYQTLGDDGVWRSDPTSDLGRIRRQQDFLRQLMKRSIDLGARNPVVLNRLITAGLDNVIVDGAFRPALVKDLATSYGSFEPDSLQTYSLPVRAANVGGREVLLPTETSAGPVIALFRGDGFDSPSTIDLRLLTPNQQSEDPGLKSLQDQGFNVTDSAAKTVDFGGTRYIVRHGPDGSAAAQVVASYLPGAQLVPVTNLEGRTIQVASASDYLAVSAVAPSTTSTTAQQTVATAPAVTVKQASAGEVASVEFDSTQCS